ncbi:phosphatidate cytidylyltransferase [Agromyces seonyuensis]|uniref:Phosphatidate cytidylyltransferase n=1 Tax=Agromyces seonyuensis TaxID=2662446 RepID=A0A6I4NZH1_9MICO|nr:phosphatidate cytidylyltransferase [Agromyces seonyuensis]MWB98632.1 CDP-archaeol synthase [Agromyces seonyuensis]
MHARKADLDQQIEATRAQYEALEQRIEARAGRNLILAILIGLAAGGLLLLSLFVVKWLFVLFVMAIVGFAVWELASALRTGGMHVPRIPLTVASVFVPPAAYFLGPSGLLATLLGAIVLTALWRIAIQFSPSQRTTGRRLLGDLAGIAFVNTYVSFLGGLAVLLTAEDGGEWWTLGFIAIAVATDVGAYIFGLSFGKHKMAPVISPKKTWEGFGGGMLFGVIVAVLLALFALDQQWWFGIVFGIAIVLAATMGDLVESLIKRDLGIKDMSSLLPGHGGFLDRLDSILPSAAVAYLAYLLVA